MIIKLTTLFTLLFCSVLSTSYGNIRISNLCRSGIAQAVSAQCINLSTFQPADVSAFDYIGYTVRKRKSRYIKIHAVTVVAVPVMGIGLAEIIVSNATHDSNGFKGLTLLHGYAHFIGGIVLIVGGLMYDMSKPWPRRITLTSPKTNEIGFAYRL